jgi:hypothetical protein
MPLRSVPRTWTIVSWLLARGTDVDATGDALWSREADVIALQSVREADVRRVAERLDTVYAWELSHHPRSRLRPGGGVGLAVLTPHRLSRSSSVVTNDHRSPWSRERRIAQIVTVERSDHSGYSVGHALTAADPDRLRYGTYPLVWVRPTQIGIDPARAVELPDGATVVHTETASPIEGVEPMLSLTFDLPWVESDCPAF